MKLGPKFIFDDPKTAALRRPKEVSILRRKLEIQFYQNKIRPDALINNFISELDTILKNLHDTSADKKHQNYKKEDHLKQKIIIPFDDFKQILQTNPYQIINQSKKKINFHRMVKRLKHKLRLTNTVIQRTDKSKVFHIGKHEDYLLKSIQYMKKTGAYECLFENDPLPDLIKRTNEYLLNLRLIHWISQKQYEELNVKPSEVQLAHLYYLPKAHKPGTPLRPIIAGIKHPTIKISKLLDQSLRPLFNKLAINTTVTSGTEVLEKLNEWCKDNLCSTTILCTLDVTDLYTMIPQTEGILSIKKMLDNLNIKQINGLTTETILRLGRFVLQNNFFTYNGQYYHQKRGGAMGLPLTLTLANCYMFFFEEKITKQITNSGGLYMRYIDDIFIIINWPSRHLQKQIDQWNKSDPNIKLSAQTGLSINFLDLYIENNNGQLFTKVYHKPSYEPYYLPFNSIHPIHMKKNIPYAMLHRSVIYCSTFDAYINEREKIRMALFLNKYPGNFINNQFNRMFRKYHIDQSLTYNNYKIIREKIINTPTNKEIKLLYGKTIFIHFTYCSNMKNFPMKFNKLWNKYFTDSPINDIKPILGTRNVNNLQQRLIKNKFIQAK